MHSNGTPGILEEFLAALRETAPLSTPPEPPICAAIQLDDIAARPFDVAIPNLLLDASEDTQPAHKRRRATLYRYWLGELAAAKQSVQAGRCRIGTVPFSRIVCVEVKFRWALLRLTVIGWLHFAGLPTPRETAVEITRSLNAIFYRPRPVSA